MMKAQDKNNPLIVDIKNRFSGDNWPWVIAALRQDPLTWSSINSSEIGARALLTLGDQPQNWSPASLALLSLNSPVGIESLKTLPLRPLAIPIRKKTNLAYEHWIVNPKETVDTLQHAGLLALGLREQRINDSWENLCSHLDRKASGLPSVLACLYGMIPDPFDLLRAFLHPANGLFTPELVIHIVLSNPLSVSSQYDIFSDLLEDLPLPQRLNTLDLLTEQRPSLARDLASHLLESQLVSLQRLEKEIASEPHNSLGGWNRSLTTLEQVLLANQVYRHSGQPEPAITLLDHAKKQTLRFQAYLAAQLATAAASHGECSQSLEAWKQATQFEPENPDYAAQLAQALMESNRFSDAQAYLTARKLDQTHNDHPALLITQAQLTHQTGKPAEIQLDAQQAYRSLVTQGLEGVSNQQLFILASLLFAHGLPKETAQTAQMALKRQPEQADFLELLAQAHLATGQPSEALLAAITAQALQPEEIDLIRLTIACLEANHAWQAALAEWQKLLTNQQPAPSDLRALASCALKAGKPEEATSACQMALELDAQDGLAYALLGEANLQTGNTQAALDYFHQATELAPNQPAPWLALAEAHQEAGENQRALEVLRSASMAAPNSPEIHLALGQASLAENAPTQALNALRRAAALIQPNAEEQIASKSAAAPVQTELTNQIALHLGQTLHRLGHLDEASQVLGEAYHSIIGPPKTNSALAYAYAKTLIELNDLQTAIQPLNQVIESHPEELEPYLDLARTLLQVDDCSLDEKRQAIDCLQQVLELNPSHAEAQALLAEAYMKVGELNHAMEAYRLALESDIANQPAWKARLAHGLGKTALGLNQTETALAVLQEAAQMEPLNPQIQRSLSEGYLSIHLYEEGIRTARTALQLNPTDVENLVWFADQALRLQQESGGQLQVRGEAINALIQSTQIAPDNAELYIRLGQVYLQGKDQAAGKQAFEKIAAIANNRANAVSSLHLYQAAKELRQLGEPATAVTLLERAVQTISEREQTPDDPSGYTSIEPAVIWSELASAHCQAGHYQAALESLDQAIAINPTDPGLFVVKADLYQELDDLQAALNCLGSAIDLAPERPNLYLQSAELLQRTGAYTQALERAEKALSLVETSEAEAEPSHLADPNLARIGLASRTLAAELARALLQPEKASATLSNAPIAEAPADDCRRYYTQRAELALARKDEGNATDALAILSELAPNHPQVLAIQARMAIRQGDLKIGNQLLNQSLRWVPPSGDPRMMNDLETRNIQRAQAQAAIDIGQWTIALSLLRRVADAYPLEPLSQLQYGRALVLRAEAQSAAQALDVIQHAPGSVALSDDTYQEMESALNNAQENTPENNSESHHYMDDSAAAIARWRARGQAIFKASTQSAIYLENSLESFPASPEDIAARIVNLGNIGEHTAASKAAQAYPRHPLVWMRLATNLAYSNPQQAKLAASRALEFWANQSYSHLYELPILHTLIATLAQRTGELDQAREAIITALEAWPDEPRWHAIAAEICLAQSQAIDLEYTQVEEAIKAAIDHLQEATRLEPDFYFHHLRLGQVFLQEREHAFAIEALTRASQIKLEEPEVWISLAQAYLGAEDLAEAASCAERGIECSSDPTGALLLRGEIALKANNPRGALTRAQTVLREQPEEPSALYLQARALEEMKRPAEALETIEQLITLVEANPLIELERARLLRQAKGLPTALEAYHKLASEYPDEAIIQAPLARALMDAGQVDEAINIAQAALQNGASHLKPEDAAYLHRMLGRQARRIGQLDQAIYHLSSAVEQSPYDIEAYLELGNAYQERRQYGEALEVYERATYINRDDHRPYFQAGQVLKENKDYTSAEEMLRRAAELAPDDLSVHRQLGAVVALNLVHNRRPTQTQI